MKGRKPFDFWLFIIVLMILSVGIIMVFSASGPFSHSEFGDASSIFKRQLMFAAIGFLAMLITMNLDYRIYRGLAVPVLGVAILLLVALFVPGLGIKENNAVRWLKYPIRFQPSEVAKFAVILFLSARLSSRKKNAETFFKGFIPHMLILGIISYLMVKQPHVSGTVIILAIAFIILFAAGTKIWHFLVIILPMGGLGYALYHFIPHVEKRINVFLDPFADSGGDGYQVIQSLYAIGSGGLTGRGLGRSMQKFLYLPYPHNDFILAILAEELGFFGVLGLMGLFILFTIRGLKIAMFAKDKFGSLMAVGITTMITIQVLLNVGVVTSVIPPTGISLPLISYGGTSLVITLAQIGILLNISKYSDYSRL